MMTWKKKIVFYMFCVQGAAPLAAQSFSEGQVFSEKTPFNITLTYDIAALKKQKNEDKYVPGTIAYYLPDSTWIEKSVRVRFRGKSRRDQCQYPPLRIDFDDSLYRVDIFDNWNKIKLVSKCMNSASFGQYIVREYLVYKAYEKLTDYSFHTYLVNINFMDAADPKKTYESIGFFIEDIDDLTARDNAIEVETTNVLNNELDAWSFNITALFQYMIGNTDWHVANLHNIKLIKVKDHTMPKPVPIPYDFDYAGIVNTNYAVVHEDLPMDHVTERYYMGFCLEKEQYQPLIALFLEKKSEIYEVFEGCEMLSNYEKKEISRYLDDFYQLLENEKLAERLIFKNCK